MISEGFLIVLLILVCALCGMCVSIILDITSLETDMLNSIDFCRQANWLMFVMHVCQITFTTMAFLSFEWVLFLSTAFFAYQSALALYEKTMHFDVTEVMAFGYLKGRKRWLMIRATVYLLLVGWTLFRLLMSLVHALTAKPEMETFYN